MGSASAYRDPITIENLVIPADPGTGELAVEAESNWQEYFSCFAEVIVKGQREFTRAGIVDGDTSHIIRVPMSTETLGVTSEMRIILHVTGEILHVEDPNRRDSSNRQVEILCRN